MRYRYRILNKNSQSGYVVQKKPVGLLGLFFPWTFVTIETSIYKARLFCWTMGLNAEIPEVSIL